METLVLSAKINAMMCGDRGCLLMPKFHVRNLGNGEVRNGRE
jgi:hypothetical protein